MPNVNKAIARRSSNAASQQSNRNSKNVRIQTTDNKEKRAAKVKNIGKNKSMNKDLSDKKGKQEEEEKPLTVEQFIQKKRNTEKGNTYYLKAQNAIEIEQEQIMQGFLNPQQLYVYNQKKARKQSDEVWIKEMVNVRMMNDLLKDNLLEVNKQMNKLFQQTYNFADRQETTPQWMIDSEHAKAQEKKDKAYKQKNMIEAVKRDKQIKQKEPWGIYMKVRPDQYNNFNPHDLPPENIEPPGTPKGRLRNKINYLVTDFKHAIKFKLTDRLENLLHQAYELAPGELEHLICHAELIIKQQREKADFLNHSHSHESVNKGGMNDDLDNDDPLNFVKSSKKKKIDFNPQPPQEQDMGDLTLVQYSSTTMKNDQPQRQNNKRTIIR